MILGNHGPPESMLRLAIRGTVESDGLFRPEICFVLQVMRTFGVAPIRVLVAADGPTVVGTTMPLPWPNSG